MRVSHNRRLYLLCVLAVVVACSSDGTDVVDPPVDPVSLGWTAFEAGNFSEAQNQFSAVIAQGGTNAEAYNGLGWTFLRLSQLSSALQQFDQAIANGFSGATVHAGRAVALRDIEPVGYNAVILAANTALAFDEQFIFEHDPSFEWHDLLLLVAQAQFALGAYGQANTTVVAIGGIGQDSKLDSFVADLLMEIERLTAVYTS